jgi:hypothetical protein
MARNLTEQLRECYRQADECGRQAAAQKSSKERQQLMDNQRRLLRRARSLEFAVALTDFSAKYQRARS